MNVLLLGGGGREHAIGWKLAQSSRLDQLHTAPGNPGLATIGPTHAIDPADPAAVVNLALRESIDLVVVGPEAPLAAGVTDAVRTARIPIFGPSRSAARLETSKSFAKSIMHRAGVPTAASEVFADAESALDHLSVRKPPYVVKADGLAAGKGVLVTSQLGEAASWVADCFSGRFGPAGNRVVIEDFLDGEEISVFGLCDGTTVLGLRTARDYKRLEDGNRGPNTGGMGTYTPVPGHGDTFVRRIVDTVITPVLETLAADGETYTGFIYAGLVLTEAGPQVLEFNCRLGDPETQALLPTLESDLLDVIAACTDGNAAGTELHWSGQMAVNVVLAAKGYPEAPVLGDEIRGLDEDEPGTLVFHAATRRVGLRTETAGGRVVSVVGLGPDLDAARDRAYDRAARISFSGKQYRTDIAQ
ncbi:MAG: phosphoribosylamine--glycine ligase [Acidimicrobiia bacterium]|nr:phosphoribosylamine--glycine ligase [Acidimicrobiia bacterium]NNF09711.1 phosphoribosylamine--glycine ligase [Acidimicrobiia bacterium]NNL71389.1 phosphoribosylamine--glycine ligase [Acidimicrobiia bacterium]